jgi:hypothetical protein
MREHPLFSSFFISRKGDDEVDPFENALPENDKNRRTSARSGKDLSLVQSFVFFC